MKQLFAGAAIGLFLLGAGAPVFAQDTVIIAPEQEVVIRDYVKKKPLASIDLPGFELNIGNPVPDTVELVEVPDVQYRYVVIGGRTALVDPGTRKIVYFLD